MADWQASVERQLDGASKVSTDAVRETQVAVTLTADGDVARAAIAKASGDAAADREALAVARHVAYPALPMGYRGQPTTVMVRLFNGASADAVDAARAKARRDGQVRYAGIPGGRMTVAAK